MGRRKEGLRPLIGSSPLVSLVRISCTRPDVSVQNQLSWLMSRASDDHGGCRSAESAPFTLILGLGGGFVFAPTA